MRCAPDLMVVGCMLPAAPAAGEAAAIPTASLVHFLEGLARHVMRQAGGSWTRDLDALAQMRRVLGLAPVHSGLAALCRRGEPSHRIREALRLHSPGHHARGSLPSRKSASTPLASSTGQAMRRRAARSSASCSRSRWKLARSPRTSPPLSTGSEPAGTLALLRPDRVGVARPAGEDVVQQCAGIREQHPLGEGCGLGEQDQGQ